MGNDGILTDDYVAELLAKEAKDSSLKYSAMGLEAYRTSRSGTKAKPNTRFLQNIIRETKSHNEALLAKEAAEAQARLDELAEAGNQRQRKLKPPAGDVRRRQLGQITAILQGKKRKRDGKEDTNEGKSVKSADHARRRTDHDRHHPDRGFDESSDEESKRRRRRRDRGGGGDRSRSPAQREREHRHRSPHDDRRNQDAASSSKHHHRSRRRDRRYQSPERRDAGRVRSSSSSGKDKHNGSRNYISHGEDDDPLADLIGPKPASRSSQPRGRGAARVGASAMDGRFADGYDPRNDVDLPAGDEGGDDWEEALEALRDRQRWKSSGAERLRAAGFTEEQVKKWERSDKEKDVQDVRWTKEGEKREWDRGKVVGLDGMVKAKADWDTLTP